MINNLESFKDFFDAIGVPIGMWQVDAETSYLDAPVNDLSLKEKFQPDKILAANTERDDRKGTVKKIEAGTTLLALTVGLLAGMNDQDFITGITTFYIASKAYSWIKYARNRKNTYT
jgi:hypothetical protein